jgi:hypothetical protein
MKRALPFLFLFMFGAAWVFPVSLSALENAAIAGDDVCIREAPTTSSKILYLADKGTRVEVTANTGVSETINGHLNFWYAVLYRGKAGYVFGQFISLDDGVSVPTGEGNRAQVPAVGVTAIRPEEIIGDWALFDPPRPIVYSFDSGGFAQYLAFSWHVETAGDRVTRKYLTADLVRGEYTIDGRTIRVTWFWGERPEEVFSAMRGEGGITLTVGSASIPPRLHTPTPGETAVGDIVINTEPDL